MRFAITFCRLNRSPRPLIANPAVAKLKIPMHVGVVVFPGSNCDHDAWYAVNHNLGHQAEFLWHDSASLGNVDAVILPGGFSYGDYLRCGAIARFSPVMNAVKDFALQEGLSPGYLQWLSNSDRSGIASRRAGSEYGASVCLQRGRVDLGHK